MTSRALGLLVSVLVFSSCAFEVDTIDTLQLVGDAGLFYEAGLPPPIGAGATPGVVPTGGLPTAPTATVATGGTGEDPSMPRSCSDGLKLCGGICSPPHPQVGCTLDDCVSCPAAPAHSMPFCSDGQCGWSCLEGYIASGDQCMLERPPPTGGASGGGNAGGGNAGGAGNTGGGSSSGSCTPSSCGPCNIAGPFPCCTQAGRCGCSWVSFAYCL